MEKKYSFGLTLIELLIAVAIIAILAILVIGIFLNQIGKGNDGKRKADLDRIKISVEEFEKDHNCYPTTVVCPTDNGLNPYLKNIPCDPQTHNSYVYEPDPATPLCPSWFRMYAAMQNTNDPYIISGIGPGGAYNYYVSSPNAPVPIPASPGGHNYGCISGSCVEINWDPQRPPSGGWECDPNYPADNCGSSGCNISNECTNWEKQSL